MIRRELRKSRAEKRFMVRFVTKAGTVTRMTATATEWQSSAFRELEEAQKRRATLEALNPGSKYAIVPIVDGRVGTQPIVE
jgi:hypothetical protein